MASAGSKELGITLDSGLTERLCAYTRSVADYPSAVKEVRLGGLGVLKVWVLSVYRCLDGRQGFDVFGMEARQTELAK